MTAPDVAARVTAWLDRLEGLHTAATPGEWSAEPNYRLVKGCRCLSCWEPIEGSWDIDPIDGPDCPQHGCWHNISLSQADAAAIVAEHNAMGSLLALARGVTALADELESFTVDRNPAPGSYDAGVVAAFVNVAARLRRLLADAAPDTGEETA